MTVVLPCLDEAESVGRCVGEALTALGRLDGAVEVLVVDNGSTDGSPEIARAAGARVLHETTRGYGAALLRGFSAAEGDIVVMADADLTYPLDRIPDLVAPVAGGQADLVLGIPPRRRQRGNHAVPAQVRGHAGDHVDDGASMRSPSGQ